MKIFVSSLFVGLSLTFLSTTVTLGSPVLQATTSTTPSSPNTLPTPTGPNTLPPSSLASIGLYELGPGDVISVNTLLNPEFAVPSLVVPPDGYVQFKSLTQDGKPKEINLIGLTTTQLATTLNDEYGRNVLQTPDFTVTLIQKRSSQPISVFGALAGSVQLEPGLRVIDALARIGGNEQDADMHNITVTHTNGQSVTLDLSHPETKGDSAENIALTEGDTIYVPLRHEMVAVTGEVTDPGAYPFVNHMTVMDAIGKAGNLLTQKADLANATLTRDGKTTTLDLYGLYHENKLVNNISLQPGDSIYIPKIVNRVYILGDVSRMGWYELKPGDRLLDALTNAGLPQDAEINKIRVITVSPNKMEYSRQICNLKTIIYGTGQGKEALKNNILLKPGMVIFVPQHGQKFGINSLFTLMSGVNLIDGAARLVTGQY